MKTWTNEQVEKLKELYPCSENDEIAKALNKTISSIQHKASRLGLKKSKEHIEKIQGDRSRGEKNSGWNGGKKKNKAGYVFILKRGYPGTDCNGYIFEHRYVMEQYLGRKLQDNEIVHHVNGIKDDNRIENLQIMTKGEHEKLHHTGTKRSDVTIKRISIKAKERYKKSKELGLNE